MSRPIVIIATAVCVLSSCRSSRPDAPLPTPEPLRRSRYAEAIPAYVWTGDAHGSSHLLDVMTHTPPKRRWFRAGRSLTTIAHESHHGLQAEYSQRRRGARFFYFDNGRGIYVTQPKMSLRLLRHDRTRGRVYPPDAYTNSVHIRNMIPASARAIARQVLQLEH